MDSIRELVCEKDGIIKRSLWIEWRHIYKGFTHGKTCLALHGCWFRDDNKPELPQHFQCHCCKKYIAVPKPNITSHTFCALEKFTQYIFAEKGTENGKKCLFEKLGFTITDAVFLQREYERQAAEKYCNGEYKLNRLDEHGQRINITIEIVRHGKLIKFKTGWMVCPHGKLVNATPFGGIAK